MSRKKADVAEDFRREQQGRLQSAEFSVNLPTETAVMLSAKSSQWPIGTSQENAKSLPPYETNTSATGQIFGDALITIKAELPASKNIISRNIKVLIGNSPISHFYLMASFFLGLAFCLMILVSSFWSEAQQNVTGKPPVVVGKRVGGVAKPAIHAKGQRQSERPHVANPSHQRRSNGKQQRGGAQATHAEPAAQNPQRPSPDPGSRQARQNSEAKHQKNQKRAPSQWLPPKN